MLGASRLSGSHCGRRNGAGGGQGRAGPDDAEAGQLPLARFFVPLRIRTRNRTSTYEGLSTGASSKPRLNYRNDTYAPINARLNFGQAFVQTWPRQERPSL
jgi:hypothetical protein